MSIAKKMGLTYSLLKKKKKKKKKGCMTKGAFNCQWRLGGGWENKHAVFLSKN